MNKNTLLFLASLVVLTTGARAAQHQSDVVELPTYVVNAPRYQPAELAINASLNALRQAARASRCIPLELPALKAQVAQPATMAQAVQDAHAARVAKS
ncbi:MAG: hypothetical protein JWQ62_234 [Lacunisphaera sp.]|nr:hypothetical protein [Lacunisphaera sp.]